MPNGYLCHEHDSYPTVETRICEPSKKELKIIRNKIEKLRRSLLAVDEVLEDIDKEVQECSVTKRLDEGDPAIAERKCVKKHKGYLSSKK